MGKIDTIRTAMVEAMKAKDKARKDSLSMLLSSLKNVQIDKRADLTEEEENACIKKELKQTQETYDLAPEDRVDIRQEALARIAVYKEFVPEDLNADQIEKIIKETLKEIELESPSASDKGKIMKVLMPKLKGKADGKLVNKVLADIINK